MSSETGDVAVRCARERGKPTPVLLGPPTSRRDRFTTAAAPEAVVCSGETIWARFFFFQLVSRTYFRSENHKYNRSIVGREEPKADDRLTILVSDETW